jgi:hypothetical protein
VLSLPGLVMAADERIVSAADTSSVLNFRHGSRIQAN